MALPCYFVFLQVIGDLIGFYPLSKIIDLKERKLTFHDIKFEKKGGESVVSVFILRDNADKPQT